MKRLNQMIQNFRFVLLLTFSFFTTNVFGQTLNPSLFKNPPSSASVHTWWHWMDNAITKEGITKDLESMKRQGISTVTILNVRQLGERDLGVPHVIFGTEEWYSMFEWALKEANRVGLKIGVHNCDGWSASGGPWITPQYAMKRVVWSKSILEGGKKIACHLPQPSANNDFYKDIRVIALPARHPLSLFQIEAPAVLVNGKSSGNLLYDANPFSVQNVNNGSTIVFNFTNDFTAEKIAIHPRLEFSWGTFNYFRYQCELKSSLDGKTFTSVDQFEGTGMNKTSTFEIPRTKAKYFQLEFKNISGSGNNSLAVSEIELLQKKEFPAYNSTIPFHLEKSVAAKADNDSDLMIIGSDQQAVPLKNVIDVTKYMTTEGVLNWDAPQGKWEVMRIGYTATGAENSPATKAGKGLECDKMDTLALNLHFRSFPAKLIARAGALAGNTFEYLFIDSWECKFQNWTDNFFSEFENRRHYSLINWLPVICGVTVDNSESTERFLRDYRQTIAELIEENYYRHFNDLCHRSGMKSHAEVIYGGPKYPPLDVLKSNSQVDLPMYEFWSFYNKKDGFITYSPVKEAEFNIAAQAGNLYGKKVIGAEAYTNRLNYSETPWDLKLFGDLAFCSGVNQIVLHSYVHQPFDRKPGFTLGEFGQSFNRHNPWWDFSSQWFTYQARIQYILQQGVAAADILYFTGDKYYQTFNPKEIYKTPEGYTRQDCNLDVLLNHCRIKNGKILLDNGVSYAMLVLPEGVFIDAVTLKRMAELVKQGAVIAGPKPLGLSGNLNHIAEEKGMKDLSAKMWGKAGAEGIFENSYGKGKVYCGISIKDILNRQQVRPDFYGIKPGMENLLCIHKKIGNSDVYFVFNQEDKEVEREVIFRLSGKVPEIWDPEYGTLYLPASYHEYKGTTVIKMKFMPKQSLFFVFNEKKTPDLQIKNELERKLALKDFKGTMTFEDLKDRAPIQIENNLAYWTKSSDPELKFYSGKVKYSIDFNLPAELMSKDRLFLSLDSVKAAYEIKLNDKLLGNSAFPGYLFNVSGLVKEKGNHMEVRVANTWRNRIIGDYTQFQVLKNIWTTAYIPNLPGKDKTLQESGIGGKIMFNY